MDLQYLVARLAGWAIFKGLRLRGSGATALPGLVALQIDPYFVRKATRVLPSIIITGTNGKTTTANLLADIVRQSGQTCIHNTSGSNLLRGITSTLLEQPQADWGIFETDEAEFAHVVPQVQPKIIVLLNLFRDQMDRYAEIDKTAKQWCQTLSQLGSDTITFCNADDPAIAWIGLQVQSKGRQVRFFGINDTSQAKKKLEHTADSLISPGSGQRLDYDAVFFSHLGHYYDKASDFRRPHPDFGAEAITLSGTATSQFTISHQNDDLALTLPLPGIFNIYNALVASAIALELKVAHSVIATAVADFVSVFGRFEVVTLQNGQTITLFLIKNPVGFSQVISLLCQDSQPKDLVIGINDRLADGTDISWLWDAPVESLVPIAKHVTTSGTRAHEMALRLKYAGMNVSAITVEPNLLSAVTQSTTPSAPCYCLLTYTALLELRRELSKQKLVAPFYAQR